MDEDVDLSSENIKVDDMNYNYLDNTGESKVFETVDTNISDVLEMKSDNSNE